MYDQYNPNHCEDLCPEAHRHGASIVHGGGRSFFRIDTVKFRVRNQNYKRRTDDVTLPLSYFLLFSQSLGSSWEQHNVSETLIDLYRKMRILLYKNALPPCPNNLDFDSMFTKRLKNHISM